MNPLTLSVRLTKKITYANSVDSGNKPPHLDIYCLLLVLEFREISYLNQWTFLSSKLEESTSDTQG